MTRKRASKRSRRAHSTNTLKSQDARRRALDALNLMRSKKWSLSKAAREALTTPRTTKTYAGVAMAKNPAGRYEAKPFDRLARTLRFLNPDGKQITVTVHSSRSASKIAEYWAAVDHYSNTGNAQKLDRFAGKSVLVGKAEFTFLVDLNLLDRAASVGEVSFEDIYAHTT